MLGRFLGKPTTFNQIARDRRKRVDREGSPYYVHSFGIIPATTGREHLEIAANFPDAKKYEPLDYYRVVNNGTQDIEIYINGHDAGLLAAGTIVSDDTPGGIWFFACHNLGGTDTIAGDVRVQFRRQPLSADALARRGG
jgi:hypothetical protein